MWTKPLVQQCIVNQRELWVYAPTYSYLQDHAACLVPGSLETTPPESTVLFLRVFLTCLCVFKDLFYSVFFSVVQYNSSVCCDSTGSPKRFAVIVLYAHIVQPFLDLTNLIWDLHPTYGPEICFKLRPSSGVFVCNVAEVLVCTLVSWVDLRPVLCLCGANLSSEQPLLSAP